MTVNQCCACYREHGEKVGILQHSGAPQNEIQLDFRTVSLPQRRVYVYVRKSDLRVISAMYWKLGENESFSKDEIGFLLDLNQGPDPLTIQISENGSEFEITTPQQYKIEQA